MVNLSEDKQLTIIIPTMAARERGTLLKRAIESARKSTKEHVSMLVVVNGSRRDKEVVEWLKQQEDVKLIEVEKPSAPNAVLVGRKLVDTPFFSTLDDDDEFLPGANDRKLKALLNNPVLSLVVTNGYWMGCDEVKKTYYSNHLQVNSRP